jgi:hypothetical protein
MVIPLGTALGGGRCSKDAVRGERKRDEDERRERCHDTLISVKECVDQGSVSRERMKDGGQRRPRDR